jgi:methionyl-tRNA synthetase
MKNYLLVPTMPTPSGPLHLGHIAGPFLRMDVLARGRRQAGDKVSIVSASDAWETHVLLRALTNDAPPDQICHRYHREIADGLAALNICYDEFIDVLDAPWRAALFSAIGSILQWPSAISRYTQDG